MDNRDNISRQPGSVLIIRKFELPKGCTGREKHQIEHRAGLELLRQGLKHQYGLTADMPLSLEKSERGKPYLAAFPWIHFNISHSGSMAACGLGSAPLGVDIEKIRPVRLLSVRRMLTEKEQDFLAHCRESQQNRELFRIWTLKESYAKALGIGLALDFTQVEFLPVPGCTEQDRNNRDSQDSAVMDTGIQVRYLSHVSRENWQFAQLVWNNEYVVSFCGQHLPKYCQCLPGA